MPPLFFSLFPGVMLKFKEQESLDKIDLEEQTGIDFSGLLDGFFQQEPVVVAESVTVYVASINREKGEDLDQRPFEAIERDIRCVSVTAGDAFEKVGKAFDISGHIPADDESLFFADNLRKRSPTGGVVDSGKFSFIAAVKKIPPPTKSVPVVLQPASLGKHVSARIFSRSVDTPTPV
jgi:hypothetical protein